MTELMDGCNKQSDTPKISFRYVTLVPVDLNTSWRMEAVVSLDSQWLQQIPILMFSWQKKLKQYFQPSHYI